MLMQRAKIFFYNRASTRAVLASFLAIRDDGFAEHIGPLQKICSCEQRHTPFQPRMRIGPWDVTALSSLLAVVSAKTDCRGLLSGRGEERFARRGTFEETMRNQLEFGLRDDG